MEIEYIRKRIIKVKLSLIVVIILLMILNIPTLANTYVNNSIEIEVSPKSRSYGYGDDITIDVRVKNNNRYASLHYKVVDVYSGGGFKVVSQVGKEIEVEPFNTKEVEVVLRDKYYTKDKKEIRGRSAYGMTEKEYEEFIRYRTKREASKNVKTSDVGRDREWIIEKGNVVSNGRVLILIIVLLIVVILIIFVWFIMKSTGGSSYQYKSVVIGLFISIIFSVLSKANKTYAIDIYEEKVPYERTVSTRVAYDIYDATIDVKIEYYFVNTIPPIIDLELDTDNDLLPDYLEVLYLTDINNFDTDGDLLPDGVEVYRTYTDPLRADTDNDGIIDSNEDYDEDGLTNLEEMKYGTDYDNPDTDYDNISDYDEVKGIKTKDGLKTYILDPISDDTDEDGLRDDVELKLNLNPTERKTDGITDDSERRVYQEIENNELSNEIKNMSVPISFYGEVKGLISENVSIKISDNSYFNEIRSIVGDPIMVDTTYGVNDGLKISFDLSKYKNIIKRVEVCKIENNSIIFIDKTYVVGNMLYSDCSSGEYFLIDSRKYIEDLNLFIK